MKEDKITIEDFCECYLYKHDFTGKMRSDFIKDIKQWGRQLCDEDRKYIATAYNDIQWINQLKYPEEIR